MRRAVIAVGLVCATSAAAGCEIVINLRDYAVVDELDGATGAAGGSGGAAGQGGTAGAGGPGGAGGTGGAGGAQVCSPGETEPCYSGADGTEGMGVCLGGTRTCDENGAGFGTCEGEVTPDKEDCTKLGNEACTGPFGCSDPVSFKQYGAADFQRGGGVAVEPVTGNTYVVGDFEGAMKIGEETFINNGGDDVFVAKLDPAGEPVWAKSFGTDGFHYARGVEASPDGSVVVLVNPGAGVDFGGGPTSLNSAIVKLDENGNFVWSKGCTQAGFPSSTPIKDLAVDMDGNVVVIGDVSGGVDCGAGQVPPSPALGERIFIAKFSAAGILQWMKTFGSVGTTVTGNSVAVDPAGNIVAGGSFTEKINFGSVDDLIDPGGGGDGFVVKLDSAGGYEWAWRVGGLGSEPQKAQTVAADSLGAAVVAVTFAGEVTIKGDTFAAIGPRDLLVLKVSSGGDYEWGKHVGSLEEPEVTNVDIGSVHLALDKEDHILLGGLFHGKLSFGGIELINDARFFQQAAYFATLDSGGNHRWSKQHAAAPGGCRVAGVAAGAGKELVTVGDFDGTFDIGLGGLDANAIDVFLARFAP